ncbi:MAG: Trm112 family protein [Calditrichia bacterium]|nr:Trm112 family protein [Calditrichia bacterium]
MLKKELLEILACPKCKRELEYIVNEKNNAFGKLNCYNCNIVFQVEDDIPIMLLDKVSKIDKGDS